MSYLQHRRKAFRGAPPQLPLHWWDLDNTTAGDGINDQGTGEWGDLNVNGAITTTSTGTPGGKSVCVMEAANQYFDDSNAAWDGSGSSSWTVSAWVYNTTVRTTGNIVSWRAASGGDRILQVTHDDATPDDNYIGVFDTDGDASFLAGTTAPPMTTWYHVVATWDGTTQRLFLDGQANGTNVPGNIGAFETTNSVPFAIGAGSWDKSSSILQLYGRIGMVGIWDVALEQSDIDTYLYNGGNGNQYADIWG